MTPKIGITLLAAGTLLAFDAAPSLAQVETLDTDKLLVHDGDNAGLTRRDENGRERKGDEYQAGHEHYSLAQLGDGRDILLLGQSSKEVLGGQPVVHRTQLACSSITLQPTGPVHNLSKYLTANRGNDYRNANAVRALRIADDAVAVMYNYQPNNDSIRYAMVVDKDCNVLMPQTEIMAKNNDDVCGNPENSSHLLTQVEGNSVYMTAACLGNGNGRDDGWVYATKFTKLADGNWRADKMWDVSTLANEERSRGTMIHIPDLNMVATCQTEGNNQPGDNSQCAGVDISLDGEMGANANSRLLWKQRVAKRDGRIRPIQIKIAPSLTVADEASMTMTSIVKNNRRGKGRSTLMMARLKFSRDGVDMKALPVAAGLGQDGTHRAMAAIPYGVDGQERDAFALISGSINGSPNTLATAQVYTWDDTNLQFVRHRSLSLNSAIDFAWISNIYGNNPQTQGRNHVESEVFINPYYGQVDGYRPKVKTFLATAATPRRMREGTNIAEDKLALELLLTPTVWAPEVVAPPEPEEPIEPTPTDPTDPTDPTPTDPSEPNPTDPSTGSTVGACSAGTNTSTGLSFLALIGLALFGATRRRRS